MKKLVSGLVATLALAAPAVTQDKIEEFRIAILGGENAQDRVANNTCLADNIEEALGVPTKLFTPADYDCAIQGLLGGTNDAAWLGASAYAKTYLTDPEAVEPVLVKVDLNGGYGCPSIGVARKHSGITSLEDMKGKVLGFGDPNSTSGYLIPSIEIPEATGASRDCCDYFGVVKFTDGHEQTIVAVTAGDIDAGVTSADGIGAWEAGYFSGTLRKTVDSGPIDMNDLVDIWRSRQIPKGPIVVCKALPADVTETVAAVCVGLIETDKVCASGVAAGETIGFQPITHDAVSAIIEAR